MWERGEGDGCGREGGDGVEGMEEGDEVAARWGCVCGVALYL